MFWELGSTVMAPTAFDWGRRREPYLSSIGQQFSESVHSAEDDVVLDLDGGRGLWRMFTGFKVLEMNLHSRPGKCRTFTRNEP